MTSRCPSTVSTLRVHRPLTKAEAELAVITKAEVAAAKGGVLSGADISVAVHAAFVAVPGQTFTRSSLAGKQQGKPRSRPRGPPYWSLRAPRARPRSWLPARRGKPPTPRLLLPLRTTRPLPRPRSSPLGP